MADDSTPREKECVRERGERGRGRDKEVGQIYRVGNGFVCQDQSKVIGICLHSHILRVKSVT